MPLVLELDSTLRDLSLFSFSLNLDVPGRVLADALEEDPLLPGVILMEDDRFAGVLSRRRFLKHLSRMYGQELFLRRPLRVVYKYAQTEPLVLPGDASIIEAATLTLGRSRDLLYEPAVVHLGEQDYRIVDVHQLLVAQARIHQLAVGRIREQRRTQIVQNEKMAILGQSIAGIAHEIKNPVNFIAGNIAYLTEYAHDLLELTAAYEAEMTPPSPSVAALRATMDIEFLRGDLPKLVESMRVGAEQLKRIVAGLQHFSHVGASSRQETDLRDCLDSTLIVLGSRLREGIEVVVDFEPEFPSVPAYAGQMGQVFVNLLANAIDALLDEWQLQKERRGVAIAAADGGWKPRIEITGRQVAIKRGPGVEPLAMIGPPIEGDGGLAPNWVVVELADNGPGIPEAIQEQIFETFFTTKEIGKGTGLGLAITHEIVTQAHGGRLVLRSPRIDVQGKAIAGTAFEVWLPLTVPNA
ncbi:MAG: hypothetical protein Fur0042_19960 [Cyanophyceae cyanobacterium]